MTSEEIRKEVDQRKVMMTALLTDVRIRNYVKLFGNDFAPDYKEYLLAAIAAYDEISRLLDLGTPETDKQAEIIYNIGSWTTAAFYILIRCKALQFDHKGTLSEDLKKSAMD